MAQIIRPSIVVAILALCFGAWTAGANEEERRVLEEWQEQDDWDEEWEEEWDPQEGKNPQNDGHDKYQNHDRDRDRDHRDELLRVPGGSADQRARDALGETRDPLPVPWVDTGPEENVDGQIEAIDRLMGDRPAVVVEEESVEEYFSEEEYVDEQEEISLAAGREMDGYSYCGSGCGGKQDVRKRGANPITYHITCFDNTKRCKSNCDECFCAVFKSPKGGTEREYVRKGNSNKGLITLDSAKEANSNDWYCYCVED